MSFQSRLQESWWAEAVECYCYLRTVQDLLAETLEGCRINSPVEEAVVPFRARVKFYPNSAQDSGGVHQFGTKVLPGIFVGYALSAGRRWTGDPLTIDTEELKAMPPSEIHGKNKSKELDIRNTYK